MTNYRTVVTEEDLEGPPFFVIPNQHNTKSIEGQIITVRRYNKQGQYRNLHNDSYHIIKCPANDAYLKGKLFYEESNLLVAIADCQVIALDNVTSVRRLKEEEPL